MNDLKLYGYKQYFDELSNIYLSKKLPNKIIFSGRKGIGKCYFVNHFINFILSINEEYSYDSNNNLINQKNKSFNLVKNNSHPNFYKIKKEDGKKNIDISQIRNLYDFVNRSSFNNKLKIVLIEDIIAVQNLDEILEVDEIDVFFVAPNDLAATMGYIGKSDHKDVQDTIENTLKRIVSSGRTAGTLTTMSALDKFLDIGVNCICVNIGPFLNDGINEASKIINSR